MILPRRPGRRCWWRGGDCKPLAQSTHRASNCDIVSIQGASELNQVTIVVVYRKFTHTILKIFYGVADLDAILKTCKKLIHFVANDVERSSHLGSVVSLLGVRSRKHQFNLVTHQMRPAPLLILRSASETKDIAVESDRCVYIPRSQHRGKLREHHVIFFRLAIYSRATCGLLVKRNYGTT